MALIELLQRSRSRRADRIGRIHALAVTEADPRDYARGIRLDRRVSNGSGLTTVPDLHHIGII